MTASIQEWATVPNRVQDLYVKYAHDALNILKEDANYPGGWVLETEEVGPVLLKRAESGISPSDLDTGGGWKHWLQHGDPLFPQVGKAWRGAQSYMGGPNPMTAMLLGGALAGGLGYGGGWLLHKMFPQWFTKQAPRGFGAAGLAAGVGVPAALHLPHALKQKGWRGLFEATPFQKENADSRFNDVLEQTQETLGLRAEGVEFEKMALMAGAGGMLPDVPTDEWGRVVMRDPYLEAQEKALAAGVPAAASAMKGSRMVSPRDVAEVAVNAGLGYGYGYLGSVAASFLGLSEPVQKGIQNAGLLAGAIRGVTGMFN